MSEQDQSSFNFNQPDQDYKPEQIIYSDLPVVYRSANLTIYDTKPINAWQLQDAYNWA